MATVSIVIPFYNTAEFLPECVESVLAQTYRDYDVLLCDNASTDGSGEIARAFARQHANFRYLYFDELIPQPANYNRALTYLPKDARYCKVVPADDWLLPGCLESMVAAAEANPRAGLVCCQWGQEPPQGFPPAGCYDGRATARRMVRDGLYLTGTPTSVMYRADLVRERGVRFYPEESYSDDTDAALELMERADVAFVAEHLCGFRQREGSMTATLSAQGAVFMYRFWQVERYGERFLEPAELQAARAVAHAQYFWLLANGLRTLRGAPFWRVHLRVLRELRYPNAGASVLAALAQSLRRTVRRAVGRDAGPDIFAASSGTPARAPAAEREGTCSRPS